MVLSMVPGSVREYFNRCLTCEALADFFFLALVNS